ncbi:MAG: ATP-binding cassette domain-containing protein [Acidobacteriota bacterium]|jgi:putative ABC transport system ATP-binding protein
MIAIRNLQFDYGSAAFELRIPRLDVAPGGHAAFIGPSGCGKTTLLNLIAGILSPRAGSIRVGETDVAALDDVRRRNLRIRRIGLVFQEFELLEYLSVLDNILLPYRINTALRLDAGVRERAAGLAASVGIGDKLARHPAELSQGERQRAAVCRALLPAPDLLLADEPTGNLDPENKQRVLELLLQQADAAGATVLAATHDHDLLESFDEVFDFKQFLAAGSSS